MPTTSPRDDDIEGRRRGQRGLPASRKRDLESGNLSVASPLTLLRRTMKPNEQHRRRQVRQIDCTVTDVRKETAHAATLMLSPGKVRPDYRPGQFLTIDPHQFESLQGFTSFLEDVKGRRETPRAYSLSSIPSEPEIAITVKDEHFESGVTPYPALLSPLLVHGIRPGTPIVIRGFSGHYVLPDDVESVTDHIVHISAGSGSVPNFSILKNALAFHTRLRHTFIYSNRTRAEIIFRSQLTELAEKHRSRLRLVHTLTRETPDALPGSELRNGRVTAELLAELIPDRSTALFYVCGPAIRKWERARAEAEGLEPAPRFMESVRKGLEVLGVGRGRVVIESYG